ncbi:YaiI/YqxD family protein [Amphritea sp. 1_MG-2023]|uniref:YaiI/YqxD family protein n=1 Tax=Amphritea sp. 1_MG-2023 TaxID=3062670 RepID=UPI0026E3B9B5|nr:YaiI/YqxD family protein [Amphritea sp. 1_MG-2023]MDO6564945.1 YaiI/YqxD family protein [Amphritea sp. 1_MG-2023]
MNIWVDADACPNVVKDILFRAADRLGIKTVLVANQWLQTPSSAYISAVQVPAGFDVADTYIVQKCVAGDLVITADIPLAAEVLEKDAHALNPRGEFYTPENIRQRLNMRDFMDQLRGSGIDTGGPAKLNQQDRQQFANQLDRFLVKHVTR